MGTQGSYRSLQSAIIALVLAGACSEAGGRQQSIAAQSCMTCHNGSGENDYSGPGLENPHPFGLAAELTCTQCHGGNPEGEGMLASHVPPPPEIGDRTFQQTDFKAYFNRLTLVGIDKMPDYTVAGVTYSALDFLQFVNPGDHRVVTQGRACGACHTGHADCAEQSLLATSAGIFSGATYAAGIDNQVPANVGRYQDTAADLAFRAVTDSSFSAAAASIGAVGSLIEFPVYSTHGDTGPNAIHNNNDYLAAGLVDDRDPATNRVLTDSALARLFEEQLAFTCGDCHLGSAGANNRFGDFRSSGCTACHMQYSPSGRSTTGDPNVNLDEPLNPDQILAPERAHAQRHLIRSTAKTLPGGEMVEGISDMACAGCHQGSNRTVMQYWGIRLDQNEDVRRGVQYPANPASFQDTRNDTRLFDPVVGNNTFNGRRARQYLEFEDYDNDGKDDTPPDVHHEAGLGCIDCHGSFDLHGGDVTSSSGGEIFSRMEQSVAINCEACHGGVDAYATTVAGTNYAGDAAQVAVDAKGNRLRHVEKDADNHYWLTSRLTGNRHYLVQTLDTIVDNNRSHPDNPTDKLYNALASYAMGRDDGNPATGIGPRQSGVVTPPDFSHSTNVSCAACHSSWTNTCIGCHLEGEYTNNPNTFSNVTGERIVFREREADFVYQSPVPFQLGVNEHGKVAPISPNTETFFRYRDRFGTRSDVFAFSNRNGEGNNPLTGHPSLSHNVMMPHSIRGKVTGTMEGARQCVACHLTDEGLANYGAEYAQLQTAMSNPALPGMDLAFFQTLRDHIGRNTGNQINSPLWVHMVAGLGSGLFLFSEDGCPTNPLDTDVNRKGCDATGAPAANFDINNVFFNLDRIVDENGVSTGSNNHPMLQPTSLRDQALHQGLSGPLGRTLIQRLANPTTGIVLNSWIDANGVKQGDAGDFLP